MPPSDDKMIYELRIISAVELPFTKHNHLPDAFVKVGLTGFEHETEVVKRSRDPQWNDVVRFTSKSRSSMVSIDVRHRSFAFLTTSLGNVRAEIGDLVDKCKNGELELDLNLEDSKNVYQGKSRLRILLSAPESTEAVEAAIIDAHKNANAIDIGKEETVVNYGDGALALVDQASNLDALNSVFNKIDIFVKIVDKTASVHPYATMAWGIVSSVYRVSWKVQLGSCLDSFSFPFQIVRNQVTTDQKLIALVSTMESVFSFVDAIQSNVAEKVKVLEDVIKSIFVQTIECSIFIREYHKQGGFGERTLHGLVKDNAGTIDNLTQSLLDLKKDFDSGVIVQTAIVSFRIQEDVSKMLRKQTLLELAPADMEASLLKGCLPSTRQDVLSDIFNWATDPSAIQNALWLYGLAGSGKTTISITIANFFRDLGRLGSFIFFDRAFPQRSHPSKVIRTLAYKLGEFDPRLGMAISAAIDNYPSIKDASLSVQFTKLIVEPLASLPDVQTGGPIVLVFDALDECGNSTERKTLLEVLGTMLSRLPSSIRILVISRPLEDITAAFQGKDNIRTWDLEVSSEIGGRDIVAYFKYHLGDIQRRKLPRRPDWPGDEAIQDLGTRSCGLFIWASTVVKFIDQFNPAKCLGVILQGAAAPGAQSALDKLYTTALEDAYSWDDIDFITYFRAMLEVILVLQNPLPATTLDQLMGVSEDGELTRILSPLACVIAHDPTLHLLHPSFADFLFSRDRCGRDIWYFDPVICHRHLALKCLDRLSNGGLKRNMLNLTLSVAPKGVKVPDDIGYACMFWITHMCLVKEDIESLVGHLEVFLNKHLLHWFEVMSILGKSKDTIALLGSLYRWATAHYPDQHSLLDFIREAWHFAQTFATHLEDHPLLVYLGALPFMPTTSAMYQIYHNPQAFLTVSGGFPELWSGLQAVLSHAAPVLSVAYSPDGGRIVTGSLDHTVRVWDILSGNEVHPPLWGHEDIVKSVAFSRDSTRIVSGSYDGTVRVWDSVSGVEVLSPLRAHEKTVNSVAFSPDGSRIVSGSEDSTVRVWDTVSGTEVLPPLLGHEDDVTSVAFSSDGTRIVSGSLDGTVRVWDAVSGTEVLPPLVGHETCIGSVAFSLDGTRIASGSDDHIRVWDTVSGIEVLPPLLGHEDVINSVAFSPDGTRIVSGADDCTMRVWDAVSGAEVVSLRRRHGNSLTSISFSPDGKHIVSGSFDCTARVWDAFTGNEVVQPLRGHEGSVTSIKFSPDGTRVISGSSDSTVRVWDVTSGTEVFPPLQGHENWVCIISLSLDGTLIASGSMDNTVCVWDAASGTEMIPPLEGHEERVESLAFSHDGTLIASGSPDHTLRVWDVVSGTEIVPPLQHEEDVDAVAFSPDGTRIVSASASSNVIHVWDVMSGTEVLPPLQGHEDTVHSLAISPDGKHIVSGSADNTVRVWDILSGIEVIPALRGHEKTVNSVMFSLNGAHIVSTSQETECIWATKAGYTLTEHAHGLGDLILSPIVMRDDGTVIDICQRRTISKVPRMIGSQCHAAYGKSLAIGTEGGQVLILNFAGSVFSSSETRPAKVTG